MRGLNKKAYERMRLASPGMEFASEMVIKAGILKLKIKEIPITLHRDKRKGQAPHLSTWSDGWRHLRFMLLYAPNSVFVWPGVVLFVVGTILIALQVSGPFNWHGIFMDIHFMILGLTLGILGVSIFQMGLVIKLFSHLQDYYREDAAIKWLNKFSLEKGLAVGGVIFLLGFLVDLYIVIQWIGDGFHGILMPRTAIVGLYLLYLGASFIFFSFLRAVMGKQSS
jgi:hypothetical protein